MPLTFPAFNLIIFFHPRSNYLWYFSSSQGLMAILSPRLIAKTFIMPFEIKKETCLRIVFFCHMRQKDQKQSWRILSSWCSIWLQSLSVLWNHTLWLRQGGGHKPNNTQTTLCIYACLNACAHMHKHAQHTQTFKNTHWPQFWGQLLMHFMVIFHPAGQWSLFKSQN